MADLTFYSSVRRGAALGITRQDDGTTPSGGDHAELVVKLAYDLGHSAETTLKLVGPGDIVGLDTRCIVRTFPRADDNEAEDAFLCYVDFDQIDLPWRYTPAHYTQQQLETGTDRVRPWLTLLVFVEGTEVSDDKIRAPRGKEKLPQLTVTDGSLLPNLADAWAWAHVQGGQAQTDEQIADALKGRPGALVARLVSPRILEKSTAYRAFLVPTFLRGVMAARGEDPDTTDALRSAWDPSPPGETVLPIYHSWRFQTGTVGSFREAARQLRPAAEMPPTVGQRQMDISDPGLIHTSPTGGAQLGMGGALQTADQADDLDPMLTDAWVNALSRFIELGNLPGLALRAVAPPLYGRWYAAEDHLDRPDQTPLPFTNPPWFKLLNSDPRFRVAAGLGTEVVQRDQQALLAAALEQTSRIVDSVNRARKVMQTGREVFTRLITRHFPDTAKGSTFLITSFLHGKILNCTGATPKPTIGGVLGGTPFLGRAHAWRRKFRGDPTPLIGAINNGDFNPKPETPPNMSTPETTVGPTIPGGLPDPGVGTIISTMNADQRLFWGVVIFWVARRLLSTDGGKYWWLLRRLLRLGLDLIQLASAQGAGSLNVLQKLRAGTLLGPDIGTLPAANNFQVIFRDPQQNNPGAWPTARIPVGGGDSQEATAFKQAAAQLFSFVNGAPLPGRSLTRADVPSLVGCILSTLSPALTFVAAEQQRHKLVGTIIWNQADKLEPILATPKISFPVWSLLRDVSPEWILPGVGDLPRNSVSLLATNQKFIEAFMTGLNHEMNRELLWNGYPTDQRGTYFQQFWDFRGWVQSPDQSERTEDKFVDIKPITEWGTTNLGTHSGRVPPAQIVLVVRGDVIKRYPNVVVYASEAVNVNGALTLNDSKQRFPVFQALLTGDTAFYGFELSADDARGGTTTAPLGYFFVLQEHPAEPHFNKYGTAANGSPGDYSNKSITNPRAVTVAADVPQQAYEQPTRVAIHGNDMLPPST
jgi:hypothetical protein